MKRLNPKTGKPFVRGEKEANKKGKVFGFYRYKRKLKNGFFVEQWTSQNILNRWRKKENTSNVFGKKGKKQLNPKTNKFWKESETRSDGYRFAGYNYNKITKDGYYKMFFIKPNKYHLQKIRQNLNKRKKSGIKVNIDVEYLDSIFPRDFICPALGIKMSWGGGYKDKFASPSMDRIDSKKGYVKGNVVWVSNKANTIKSDSSIEEMEKVLLWYKKIKTKLKKTT
tara:strand:- start:114 stop:788 length:675 start_codon:yes stop_codon:yes gene_type:complete